MPKSCGMAALRLGERTARQRHRSAICTNALPKARVLFPKNVSYPEFSVGGSSVRLSYRSTNAMTSHATSAVHTATSPIVAVRSSLTGPTAKSSARAQAAAEGDATLR